MLSALRGGHVALNGEIKAFLRRHRNRTTNCLQDRCSSSTRESITHYVFHCQQFANERRRMEDQVKAEYESLEPSQPWLTRSETERWQMLLFPLQAEISEEREDKDNLKMLVDKRIRILHSLLNFVFATKRFPEGRVDLSYYEL